MAVYLYARGWGHQGFDATWKKNVSWFLTPSIPQILKITFYKGPVSHDSPPEETHVHMMLQYHFCCRGGYILHYAQLKPSFFLFFFMSFTTVVLTVYQINYDCIMTNQ